MKEMLNQDIRSIEDREMRWLVRYEKIIAWHNAGGFAKAAAAYHAQIADADRVKSEAELRVAQITILQHTVAGFDVKALRNAQMEKIAAQRKAEVAAERERRQIQAAIDELIAIDDFVTDDDIDDILAISSALGIELPAETDRADICQRGFKSIESLKRELGVSIAKHVEQEDDDRDTNLRVRPSKITHEWIMENVIVLDAETCDWLDKHYPDDGLDNEALDSATQIVGRPVDAGKKLAEIGWKPLEKAKATKPAPASEIDESLLETLLDWYEAATIKMANSRARNASSDLYEGVDSRWFSVRSRRKSIIDYVLGRDNADVMRARMAT